MREPFVSVRGLVKIYPGVVAVDRVNLHVDRGEVLGLVGKNAAGKSTVIRILAGVERPDTGGVLIDGKPVPDHYDARTAKGFGFAFVSQELQIVPELSVSENIMLGNPFPTRSRIFISRRQMREAVKDVLSQLDLQIDPSTVVGELKSAQQRMVMIARALYEQAQLLFLDEPSASLSAGEIRHLFQIIRRLKANQCAVVYVSHRLQEIMEITDRIVVMRDGRVEVEKPTSSFDRRTLIAAITGDSAGRTAFERRQVSHRKGSAQGKVMLGVRDFSREELLSNVSFDVHAGEILGLGGLVGSGRTELVRMIVGADPRDGGTLTVKGREANIRNPHDGLEAGIALLPEDRRNQGLVLGLSIRENTTMATLRKHRLLGLPVPSRASEKRSAQAMIKRLTISTPSDEQKVRFLSGGNQQKVVLAKWLEHNVDIFIFDEPTQGIDVQAKQEVFSLIEGLAGEGKGVIFISSEFSELVLICHRVIVLREGRISGELYEDEINEKAIVDLCYTTKAKVAEV